MHLHFNYIAGIVAGWQQFHPGSWGLPGWKRKKLAKILFPHFIQKDPSGSLRPKPSPTYLESTQLTAPFLSHSSCLLASYCRYFCFFTGSQNSQDCMPASNIYFQNNLEEEKKKKSWHFCRQKRLLKLFTIVCIELTEPTLSHVIDSLFPISSISGNDFQYFSEKKYNVSRAQSNTMAVSSSIDWITLAQFSLPCKETFCSIN